MIRIPRNVINQFVLAKQHLVDGSPSDSIVQIVQDVGGLHASGATVPYLSLFARARDFTRAQLDEALYVQRTLGKVRGMRKTVHILPKNMIPIVFAATRRLIEPTSEKYAQYLGITSQEYEETSKKILVHLQRSGMTVRALKTALRTRVNISPIVNLMCDRGLLIRGPPHGGWKSNLHTYYRFSYYFPDIDLHRVDEETARRQVVEQYLTAFGPATETDVAWWTGFPRGQVRKLMTQASDSITPVEIPDLGRTFFTVSSQRSTLLAMKPPKTPIINVLPSLDPYLMGYKVRERYLHPHQYKFIFDRSGNATSTILRDGQVIGIWDFTDKTEPTVKVLLFKDVENHLVQDIYRKATAMGRFIADQEVHLQRCNAMVPLTQRPAGGVFSPLKSC